MLILKETLQALFVKIQAFQVPGLGWFWFFSVRNAGAEYSVGRNNLLRYDYSSLQTYCRAEKDA